MDEKVKFALEPNWPTLPELVVPTRSITTPPGWDVVYRRLYLPAFCQIALTVRRWERHCESEVYCPRTQQNDLDYDQRSNPILFIVHDFSLGILNLLSCLVFSPIFQAHNLKMQKHLQYYWKAMLLNTDGKSRSVMLARSELNETLNQSENSILTAWDRGTMSPNPMVVNVMKMKYSAVPKSQPSRAQYTDDINARNRKIIGNATHTGALICASADSNS